MRKEENRQWNAPQITCCKVAKTCHSTHSRNFCHMFMDFQNSFTIGKTAKFPTKPYTTFHLTFSILLHNHGKIQSSELAFEPNKELNWSLDHQQTWRITLCDLEIASAILAGVIFMKYTWSGINMRLPKKACHKLPRVNVFLWLSYCSTMGTHINILMWYSERAHNN